MIDLTYLESLGELPVLLVDRREIQWCKGIGRSFHRLDQCCLGVQEGLVRIQVSEESLAR